MYIMIQCVGMHAHTYYACIYMCIYVYMYIIYSAVTLASYIAANSKLNDRGITRFIGRAKIFVSIATD